jgi:hypothetical protein
MERQPVMNAPHPLEGIGTSSDPFRNPDPQTSSTMQLMARPVVRNSFHRTTIIEFLSSMEAIDIYLWYMERPQRDTAQHRVFIENYDTIIPEISRRTKIAFDQRVVDVLCRHIVHHNGLVTHAMADFPPRFFQPWMHTIGYTHLEVLLLELSTAAESRMLDEQGANITRLAEGYIERIRRFRHAACESLTYLLMSRLILYQVRLVHPESEPGANLWANPGSLKPQPQTRGLCLCL